MMQHVWLNKIGKTEDDLLGLISMSREGSHNVLINQIGGYIKEKNKDERKFSNSSSTLKRLRVRSDYKNLDIDSKNSYKAVSLSKELRAILNSL